MINYDNFWETMNKKGITKYSLIYHYGISSNTLRRMRHNEPITTSTINDLCLILHCQPQDILSYKVTEEEKEYQRKREYDLNKKKKWLVSLRQVILYSFSNYSSIMEHIHHFLLDYSGALWATCPDFGSHHSGEWEPHIPVIQSHI